MRVLEQFSRGYNAMSIDRRRLLAAAFALPFAFGPSAFAGDVDLIADMHFHLFFFGPNPAAKQPLGKLMASGNASLVSWSLVGDVPWIRPSSKGLKQTGTPKPGEALEWFRAELGRIKQHIADQKLKIATTPADIDRALAGDPHVVLSVEGASFLDDDLAHLRTAYDLGIRHLQLVHYIRNRLGDFQTERPEHAGLTELGRNVILECNRLGILVDLAHCTSQAVNQALAVSNLPMVWSHSSVTRGGKPSWRQAVGKSRQLRLDDARAIAAKGGVIGLWTLRSDIGTSLDAYADRMVELAGWLGDDHVAFGTDLNATANPPIVSYADLQRVVGLMRQRGMSEAALRNVAIGNYARVLRQALEARKS